MRLFLYSLLILSTISFSLPPQPTAIVLIPDQVIDGISEEPHQEWKILIEDGIITSAGPDINIPEGTQRLELKGQTVLPGLIDMHGHLYANNGKTVQNEPAYLNLYLAGGVTTIFSPGEYEPYKTLEYKKAIERGEMEGPEVLTAGPYFDKKLQTLDEDGNPMNKADLKVFF